MQADTHADDRMAIPDGISLSIGERKEPLGHFNPGELVRHAP